jgi:uncharacterized protein YdhG (YjbR/CyaY superfamily)
MPPNSIDEYLAGVPSPQREALQRLREQIHAAAPDAVEAISYGLPAFRLDGRFFAGFSATREGCSYYAGKAPIEALRDELAGYRLQKGTISFRPHEPIPPDLVTRLVKLRLAEYRGELEATQE